MHRRFELRSQMSRDPVYASGDFAARIDDHEGRDIGDPESAEQRAALIKGQWNCNMILVAILSEIIGAGP